MKATSHTHMYIAVVRCHTERGRERGGEKEGARRERRLLANRRTEESLRTASRDERPYCMNAVFVLSVGGACWRSRILLLVVVIVRDSLTEPAARFDGRSRAAAADLSARDSLVPDRRAAPPCPSLSLPHPGLRPARLGVSRRQDTASSGTPHHHRQRQHHGVRYAQEILGIRSGTQPRSTQQATEVHADVVRITRHVRVLDARRLAAAEIITVRRDSQQIDAW